MAEPAEGQSKGGATETNGTSIPGDHATNIKEARDAAEGDNKFQQAIAAWRALGLTKLVSSLDTAAAELVAHQKDSLVQRKELAQKTKDFRKLEDQAKLVEIKDLLKAYQGYVDVLTNHNKTINSAFMQAYSPLSEAPDPYPLLEASTDSLVTADEVLPKLESENEHLQKQVSRLNTQLEESEQHLEAERTKRQSFEGSQDTKIKEVEDSWSAVLKEKEDNWAAKERSLEKKVENQDRLLKELKASYEVSQRLEKSEGEDVQEAGRGSASVAELEIVNNELEKANVRLADVEARNEQLRVELAQSASQAHSSSRSTNVEDEPAFLRLRSENSYLLRRLDSARYDKDSEKSSLEAKLRSVEREVFALKADRDAFQSKVQKWSDYDEVKRELDMLRAIEFATVEDVDLADGDDTSHANGGAPEKTTKGESLEQLLLARNKKLSNELTELRVSHNELQRRLATLQEDLSSTNMDLEKARNLNASLENDIQKTQQEASNAFETMSVAGTYTSRYPKSGYGSLRKSGGGKSRKMPEMILGQVRSIVKEEVKILFRDEVQAVLREEVRAVVQEEVKSMIQDQVTTIIQEHVTAVVQQQLASVQLSSPSPSYAGVARTPPGSQPRNIRTVSMSTSPSTMTDTLYCTVDTSTVEEKEKGKTSPGTMREEFEKAMGANGREETWHAAAVTKDPRNHARIRITCRDEVELARVKAAADVAKAAGA